MASESTVHETTATVEAASGAHHGGKPVMQPDAMMVGLTWLTFGLLAAVLYKVAWKPILAGLEKREADIRQALEDAQKAREELAKIEESRARTIAEADAKAREIVEAARRGAAELATSIEAKARQEAQGLVANAQREIQSAQDKAMAALRRESAQMAVDLARKIMREQLDEPRGRALAERLIQQV
jgi:F-type H+-transporting ATPase subunit b